MNQIDHVVINNKWRRSFKDVHTCRDADAGINQDDVLKAFIVEISNKFQCLSTEETDYSQVEGTLNQIMDYTVPL